MTHRRIRKGIVTAVASVLLAAPAVLADPPPSAPACPPGWQPPPPGLAHGTGIDDNSCGAFAWA